MALNVHAAEIKVLATRAQSDPPRTSVMILVANASKESVKLNPFRLAGTPLTELMAFDDKRPKLGRGVDWFDIRPATIPPGETGVVIIGYASSKLFAPRFDLRARAGETQVDLSAPTPQPHQLAIASATFDDRLRRLTLIVRNDPQADIPTGTCGYDMLEAEWAADTERFSPLLTCTTRRRGPSLCSRRWGAAAVRSGNHVCRSRPTCGLAPSGAEWRSRPKAR